VDLRTPKLPRPVLRKNGEFTDQPEAAMAIDAYLQIDGIKGESADDKHREWIECLDVDFGVDQPRSP
jgi:hypothetical protein